MRTIAEEVEMPRPGRWLLYTFALMLALQLATPAKARAVFGLKECMDEAWKNYNACLVEAGTSKWSLWLCDRYFSADTILCSAKYIGEVRTAAGGDDDVPEAY